MIFSHSLTNLRQGSLAPDPEHRAAVNAAETSILTLINSDGNQEEKQLLPHLRQENLRLPDSVKQHMLQQALR